MTFQVHVKANCSCQFTRNNDNKLLQQTTVFRNTVNKCDIRYTLTFPKFWVGLTMQTEIISLIKQDTVFKTEGVLVL